MKLDACETQVGDGSEHHIQVVDIPTEDDCLTADFQGDISRRSYCEVRSATKVTERRMYTKPLWTLLLVTIFLPELMTGATPVTRLANPATWILYLFAYGIPVLLLRELAVRYNVSFTGLVIFGLAYGIVNEGLFARTLLRETGLPVDKYDHYGILLHVNFAWAAVICTWHAFASCALPIMFVHSRSRSRRRRPGCSPVQSEPYWRSIWQPAASCSST